MNYTDGIKFYNERTDCTIISVEHVCNLSSDAQKVLRLPEQHVTHTFHKLTKKGKPDMRTRITAPHESFLKWVTLTTNNNK